MKWALQTFAQELDLFTDAEERLQELPVEWIKSLMQLSEGQSHAAFFRVCASRSPSAAESDIWLAYLKCFPQLPLVRLRDILARPLAPRVMQAVSRRLCSHLEDLSTTVTAQQGELQALREQMVRFWNSSRRGRVLMRALAE